MAIIWHGHRLTLNCSIQFPYLPVLEQPAAAARTGFDAVEFWWPFATPSPSPSELAAFASALAAAGTQLMMVNSYAGDLRAGDRGIASTPGREADFVASVTSGLALARLTGCRVLHVLFGNRLPGADTATQDRLAATHLRYAADAAAADEITVVVEALSGAPDYPLRTAADVLAVLDRVGRPNVSLLADIYHLATNGGDPARLLAEHLDRIGHVQLADAPGRGAPGTGTLPLGAYVDQLVTAGYAGEIGLEYVPGESGLGWLDS